MDFRAHPFTRIITTTGLFFVFAFVHNIVLLILLTIIFISIGFLLGVQSSQLRLIRTAILPLFIVLSLVWGVFLQTKPGDPVGHDSVGGFLHAIQLCLSLSFIGSSLQVLWLFSAKSI